MAASSLLAVLVLAPLPTLAQDFTVEAGPPVGQQTMNFVGDSGVIEVGGTVSTAGADAVEMLADEQALANYGVIATTGDLADGIYSTGAFAAITNSGNIATTGLAAFGISSAGPNAVITNSGGIATTGGAADGIYVVGADATITNSGNIHTTGSTAFGIHSTGANAVITNSGGIETVEDFSFGLYSAGGSAQIINSGSITTTGDLAYGIRSTGANVVINNSGSIVTTGQGGYGIVSEANGAAITNSGSIETTGVFGLGIYSTGAGAAITNSGSIDTKEGGAVGIYSTGAFTITNSGTIETAGAGAYGIFSGAAATITNSGSIHTAGSAVHGIIALAPDTTITNSGSIVSEQADAIHFNQGGATLNLLAGTAIQGGLYFAGIGNSVRFGPGLNALMTFSGAGLPGTVETSGNPFVTSGNTIAVLDRGGFVLAEDMTLTLVGDIAGAAGRGLAACMPVSRAAGEVGDQDCSTRAWLTGIGGFGGDAGSADLAGFEHLRGGGLVGLEFMPEGGISGGLFVGAAGARGTVGTSQETTQYGAVAGGHAGIERDGYFADFYAALGVVQVESRRTIADNMVVGGLDLASATYAGYFLNPAVTLGTDIDTGHGTLTPSVRLRYTGLTFDGYAESGADDGLAVDARAAHEVELRAQLALALLPRETGTGVIAGTLRAGADIIHRQGDTIAAELFGQDIDFASGGDGTRYRGFAALDLDVVLTGGASLTGGLEAGIDTAGGFSAVAQAGISGAF